MCQFPRDALVGPARFLVFYSFLLLHTACSINASLSEADGNLERVSLKGIRLQMGADR